ncbi:MAG: hypothetical protein HY774_25705 [Acidobacteria bacterium]|nr:hypothetical protein [Acidobacteriota bacterium]
MLKQLTQKPLRPATRRCLLIGWSVLIAVTATLGALHYETNVKARKVAVWLSRTKPGVYSHHIDWAQMDPVTLVKALHQCPQIVVTPASQPPAFWMKPHHKLYLFFLINSTESSAHINDVLCSLNPQERTTTREVAWYLVNEFGIGKAPTRMVTPRKGMVPIYPGASQPGNRE